MVIRVHFSLGANRQLVCDSFSFILGTNNALLFFLGESVFGNGIPYSFRRYRGLVLSWEMYRSLIKHCSVYFHRTLPLVVCGQPCGGLLSLLT